MTSFQDELISESRASIQEGLLPYVIQRIWAERTTAISEPRRFFVLAIGAFACICASTSYVYNLFSGRLQEKYDFSQTDMSTITTTAVFLSLVAFPLAAVYDHYGPRPLFLVGMTAFPLGAVLFGLAFNDVIEGSVWKFSVFYALLNIGSCVFDIASLMTVMSIFPSSRGAVIAVMKTFIGLGSAIFGAIQLGFYEGNISGFFNFMAVCVAVIGVLSFIFIQLPPYQLTGWEEAHLDEAEKRRRGASKKAYYEQVPPARRFMLGFVLVFLLILFLPVQSVVVAVSAVSHTEKVAFALVTISLVLLIFTIALPVRCLEGGSESIVADIYSHDGTTDAEDDSPDAQLRLSMRMASTRRSIVEDAVFRLPLVDESEHIAPQYQTSFCESLCTAQLWMMTFSLFGVMGTQMVIITNARFIYAAVAEKPISSELATLLTVFNGTGSAIGRIFMSLFEMWTQRRSPEERIPLTIALFIPTTLMLISSLLLLFVPSQFIVLPFGFTALANGFGAASVVLVTRTIYAKDMANHYNFMSLGTILASFLLNRLLYGEWYSHKARQHGGNLCYGRDCVFLPFAIMTALLLTSLAANLFVHLRYTHFAAEVLAQRRQARSNLQGNNDEDETSDAAVAAMTGISNRSEETQPLLRTSNAQI